MSDLISRQEAIALADSLKDELPDDERVADCMMAHNEGILEYQTALSLLPSAQPESLTDSEQRIFLAAMEREEKVCKQVDEECRYCREPYERSLVRTCHEITRKVKGALWMI